MKSFAVLQAKISQIEKSIWEKFEAGEEDVTSEQEQIDKLENQIVDNVREYVWLIKDKFFEKAKEKVDKKIESLVRVKNYLDDKKQFIEKSLHNYAEDYLQQQANLLTIKNEEDEIEFYVSPKFSINKKVNPELVSDEEMLYKIPKLTHDQWLEIISIPNLSLDLLTIAREQVEKVAPTVTSLPENHKAIFSTIRSTVGITKTRPKEKQ